MELCHYGVVGMHWGIRKEDIHPNNMVIKKGTIVKRVSRSREDPIFDNKKYVSLNEDDYLKWDTYLGNAYIKRNEATFKQTYVTKNDLKVMSKTQQGKMYTDMLLNTDFKSQAIKDTKYVNNTLALKPSSDSAENISRNIALQTQTGKAFVNKVLKTTGYQVLYDTHGTNVSDNPMIILNANKNIKKFSEPEYTDAVNRYLSGDWYGFAS